MLTAEELASWRETLRVWRSVSASDVSELAEIMAALDAEEREQIWALIPDDAATRAGVEGLLHSSR